MMRAATSGNKKQEVTPRQGGGEPGKPATEFNCNSATKRRRSKRRVTQTPEKTAQGWFPRKLYKKGTGRDKQRPGNFTHKAVLDPTPRHPNWTRLFSVSVKNVNTALVGPEKMRLQWGSDESTRRRPAGDRPGWSLAS
jgi:hypothetical protein